MRYLVRYLGGFPHVPGRPASGSPEHEGLAPESRLAEPSEREMRDSELSTVIIRFLATQQDWTGSDFAASGQP